MLYSFTGKLGLGADVAKYLVAQHWIRQRVGSLVRRHEDSKLELATCPVIDDDDDFVEKSYFDSGQNVIFLCFRISARSFETANKHQKITMILDGAIGELCALDGSALKDKDSEAAKNVLKSTLLNVTRSLGTG